MARAEYRGVVFLDRNADGVRDPSEPPLSGVTVSNGREVVRSDSDGGYSLPERSGDDKGFVFITRPRGFECAEWYRRASGDFALVPARADPDFFFVHLSDVHAYDRAQDFRDYSTDERLSWAPRWLQAWISLRIANRLLKPRFTDDVAGELRDALSPYRDVGGLGETRLFLEYLEEFYAAGSELGDVRSHVRGALKEIAGLRPTFLVSTGDLVLEGNLATPEVVERWMRFYHETSHGLGVPVYNTIGNNELAGSHRDDVSVDDPGYGKQHFEAFYGPTYYSFDRGAFHFAVLDTHRRKSTDRRRWHFTRMTEAEQDWLDADLSLHGDAVLVALNHEPFELDSSWPVRDTEDLIASDEGLFARHGVDYVLAGHTHLNGFVATTTTTHITTGALSGFRWLLPPGLYPRGYRLFYARDRQLYSAWKEVGSPVIGFVDPVGDASLHPASKGARRPDALDPDQPVDIVAVAADRHGPFVGLRLHIDGEPVAFERWGDYFLHARLAPKALRASGATLVLVATRASGDEERAELRLTPRTGVH